MNTRQSTGLFRPDRENVRVCMRGAQDLEMEHPIQLHVSGVMGRAGNNGMGERILQTPAVSSSPDVVSPAVGDLAARELQTVTRAIAHRPRPE